MAGGQHAGTVPPDRTHDRVLIAERVDATRHIGLQRRLAQARGGLVVVPLTDAVVQRFVVGNVLRAFVAERKVGLLDPVEQRAIDMVRGPDVATDLQQVVQDVLVVGALVVERGAERLAAELDVRAREVARAGLGVVRPEIHAQVHALEQLERRKRRGEYAVAPELVHLPLDQLERVVGERVAVGVGDQRAG